MTLQVVFVILNRLERCCALSAGEGRIKSVKAEKVIEWTHDRQVHNFFGQALQRVNLALFVNVVRNFVGVIQLCAVDCF